MCPILFYANDYILSIDIKKDNLLVFLPLSSPHYSAHENFFQKKHTHAGSIVNTTLPAWCIYHFTLQNLQSSAQNYQNAEETAILYNIEAHKKQRQK